MYYNFVCLRLYVPVNIISVILGRLPGFNGTKQWRWSVLLKDTTPRNIIATGLGRLVKTGKVHTNTIIAWKALGRDCTNNNGPILQIGVLSS